MSLTIKEINYDNLDDLKKLESALKNWFTNPKELNFTDPNMQYPFDMKKWININYKLNEIETIALSKDDWIIGFGGVKFFEKSNLLLKTIHSYDSSLIKIGVGGVFNKEDFQQKIESGASLVQIYTSFIYQGPRIINKLLN